MAARLRAQGLRPVQHWVPDLLNPKVLVFGGALFREIPQLIADPVRRIIKQRALERSAQEVELKVSALGGEASALGAARLIAEKIIGDLFVNWPAKAGEAIASPAPKNRTIAAVMAGGSAAAS